MATIQVFISDDIVKRATELGLLEPATFEAILRAEIRRRAFSTIAAISEKLAAAGEPPLSEEEIVAEVKAARAEQHATNA